MRVAYLSPVSFLGGAERCLLSVMRAVRETAPDAELHLIASAEGPLLREAEELGVRTRALPMPDGMARMGDSALRSQGWGRRSVALVWQGLTAAPGFLRYVKRLQQTLEEIGPELIHSNGIKTHLLARLAAPPGTPVVWHIHDFLSHRPIMARVLRWAAGGAAGAIAISQAVRRDARKVLGVLPVRLIYNGVNVDEFSPAPGNGRLLDRLAGLPVAGPGTVRVGLVATYARWKGHDLFLEAAARLLRQRPNRAVRFYLVGGPIYATRGSQFSESELRARAAELGIAHAVGFIGFRHDVADVYRALDIMVHASTRPEPFGLTIVEAMACGRSVVVSQAGGAAELFTDKEDALATPPQDAEALASAVGELVADPDRRQRIAERARRTAVTRFSSGRLGPELLAAYDRFANGGVSRRGRRAAWR